jgi:hypothetical protein
MLEDREMLPEPSLGRQKALTERVASVRVACASLKNVACAVFFQDFLGSSCTLCDFKRTGEPMNGRWSRLLSRASIGCSLGSLLLVTLGGMFLEGWRVENAKEFASLGFPLALGLFLILAICSWIAKEP